MINSKLNQFLSCAISEEKYILKATIENPMCLKPKTLFCQHTFCELCINKLHDTSTQKRSIKCPNCRRRTPIPNGVTTLQDNLLIIGLLDICEDNVETVFCLTHKSKSIDLYCETCKQSCCSICFVSQHQGHEVSDFHEAMEREKQILETASIILEKEMNFLIARHYRTSYFYQKKCLKTIKSIHEESNALVNLIREKEKNVITEIELQMAQLVTSKISQESKLVEIKENAAQVKKIHVSNTIQIVHDRMAKLTKALEQEHELDHQQLDLDIEICSQDVRNKIDGLFQLNADLILSSSFISSASSIPEESLDFSTVEAAVSILQNKDKTKSPQLVVILFSSMITRLFGLSVPERKDNKDRFAGFPGTIQSLLDVLVLHIDSADVLEQGFEVINHFTFNDEISTRILGNTGGACDVIVACLRSQGAFHDNVANSGLTAISNLSVYDDDIRTKLGAAGACQLVCDLFDTYLSQPTINQQVIQISCWALLHLICDNHVGNIALMRGLHMKEKLRAAVINNPTLQDKTTQEKARSALLLL